MYQTGISCLVSSYLYNALQPAKIKFSHSRYVEKEHLQYCAPSNLSSGLATLPLDYVYINGSKTDIKTTKMLPTGEKLDGRATYLKLLQYFTTTEKTPDEIYELGWSLINRSYPEVRWQFSFESLKKY